MRQGGKSRLEVLALLQTVPPKVQTEYLAILGTFIITIPPLLLALRRAPKPEKEKEGERVSSVLHESSQQLVGHFGNISAQMERLERNQQEMLRMLSILMDRWRRD